MGIRIIIDTISNSSKVQTKSHIEDNEDTTIGEVAATILAMRQTINKLFHAAKENEADGDLRTAMMEINDRMVPVSDVLGKLPKGCFQAPESGISH